MGEYIVFYYYSYLLQGAYFDFDKLPTYQPHKIKVLPQGAYFDFDKILTKI